MPKAANLLAEPVKQFVADLSGVLSDLRSRGGAGKGSAMATKPSGSTDFERDAALEAQAIAAAVIAGDGRYGDSALREFAAALAPWFESLATATPQQLRDGDAIR